MSLTRAFRSGLVGAAALALTLGVSATASAQAADPNPGNLTFTGNIDFVNQYMFRGIRQNSSGMAIWPSGDLGLALYSGEGGLKSAAINFGTWNSQLSDTAQNAEGKLWYESDFYSTLSLGFGGGASVAATYTAYTSPNNSFTTVKEIMFKIAEDDSALLGKASLKPYVAMGFEFDTKPGAGQADGGDHAGKYLELGVSPGYAASKASLTVPIKVGLSMGDYYEMPGTGVDSTFGYFSTAAIVTVPIGGTTNFGSWNVHGGVEFQKLGDTTAFFNGDKDTQVIYSGGIGFTY